MRKLVLILHQIPEERGTRERKGCNIKIVSIMRKDSIISLMNTFISSETSYENVKAMVCELGLELNSVEFVL